MRLWGEESDSAGAVESAKEVCRIIGIEHRVLDLREIFRQEIIDYFLDSYVQACTPNPCVRCNQKIKFGTLMKLLDLVNVEMLATGHYARTGWKGFRAGTSCSRVRICERTRVTSFIA